MASYITASIGRISRENALKIMTLPNEEGQGSTVGDAAVFFLCCTIFTHLFFFNSIFPFDKFPFLLYSSRGFCKKRSSSLPCFFPRVLYPLDMSADIPLAPAFNRYIDIYLVISFLSCRRYYRLNCS